MRPPQRCIPDWQHTNSPGNPDEQRLQCSCSEHRHSAHQCSYHGSWRPSRPYPLPLQHSLRGISFASRRPAGKGKVLRFKVCERPVVFWNFLLFVALCPHFTSIDGQTGCSEAVKLRPKPKTHRHRFAKRIICLLRAHLMSGCERQKNVRTDCRGGRGMTFKPEIHHRRSIRLRR
jgi:hypothetical protein